MVEDKEERKEEAVVERPTSFQDFFNQNFGKLAFFALLLFLAGTVEVNGKTFLDTNQMVLGFAVLLVVFFLIPSMAFLKKKGLKPTEITPVNPLEEIPMLREQFARLGRDIVIERVESDPFEGEGAGQPEVYHYIGHETHSDGRRVPFSVSQGSLTKFATKFNNTRYIETSTFSSGGTRKRPSEPQPRQQAPLFVTTPRTVQYVLPERKNGKEEEKEKEEEEESE